MLLDFLQFFSAANCLQHISYYKVQHTLNMLMHYLANTSRLEVTELCMLLTF